jgi:hypothetical protein
MPVGRTLQIRAPVKGIVKSLSRMGMRDLRAITGLVRLLLFSRNASLSFLRYRSMLAFHELFPDLVRDFEGRPLGDIVHLLSYQRCEDLSALVPEEHPDHF